MTERDDYDAGENPSDKVLYLNMAPFGLNMAVSKDMENLLGFGRAIWQAACAWQRQQGMSALSLRKLDSLIADGYRVNGVAIRRDGPGKIPKQGFITDHGMVGWWPGNEAPDGANKIRSTE